MLSMFFFLSLFVNNIFADTECPVVTTIEDRRKDTHKLRIAQYNVEWLFIDYCSSSNCPGSGCTWKNSSEADTHMSYISKVVNTIQPDIINFCEVEGCDELNILAAKLDGSYKPYLKKGTDSSTGQNVGMLTRIDPIVSLYRTELRYDYPIYGSKCGYTGTTSSSGVSKHYITEFVFNRMNVALISAHLIAYPTDPSRCVQREAQAMILQSVIFDYINRDYEIIMLGDFNDFDGKVLDVNNNIPISQVLDILKGNYGDFSGKYSLHTIAETITQKERFSDWYDSDNNCNTASSKDYSMIDHILVTDGIQNNIVNAFMYHEYNEYCGKYDSDHYPVIIDLAL
jgi:exonuclease III